MRNAHWTVGPDRDISVPCPLAKMLRTLRTHGARLLVLAISDSIADAWSRLEAELDGCRTYYEFADRVGAIRIPLYFQDVAAYGLSRATFYRAQREIAESGWITWHAVPGDATYFSLTGNWYWNLRSQWAAQETDVGSSGSTLARARRKGSVKLPSSYSTRLRSKGHL